jgi:hypothetical protein
LRYRSSVAKYIAESMQTIASKKPAANGSDRASQCSVNTPSAPVARTRCRFVVAGTHRSTAQT